MANQKTGINSLNPAEFIRMAANRLKAVSAASDAPVSTNKDHLQNRLAAALHPHVQFLNVSEVIVHSEDVKSYILTPHRCGGTEFWE